MKGDYEMIFGFLDEEIPLNLSEEKSTKSARKIFQIFCSTLRIGSFIALLALLLTRVSNRGSKARSIGQSRCKSVVACLCLGFITGCGTLKAPDKEKTLRISFPAFPSSADPRKSGDFVSGTLVCLLYEGLMRCLPDGTVEPGIAEQVDLSEEERIYTFHLRRAHWSDGTPVTARDFERSWKGQLDPANPSANAYLFFPIKGAKSAAKGEASLSEVGVRAIDDLTLQVELEHPTPYFLSLTAFPSYLPSPTRGPTLQKGLLCNGPYAVESVAQGTSIQLKKNPLFWKTGSIEIEAIQIAIIPDENTALQLFEQGELDWLGGALSPIPEDALHSLAAKQSLHYYSMAASTFCVFNTSQKPFSNPRLRRALSLAIDREKITRKALQGSQIAARGAIPPSIAKGNFRGLDKPCDLKVAKQEWARGLAELGITEDQLGPIALHCRATYTDRIVAEALKSDWEAAFGIEVQIKQTDYKWHKNLLHSRNYQVCLAYWIAQYNDPFNLLERFRSGQSAKNYSGWESLEFCRLLDLSQAASDEAERIRLLEEAEKILLEQAPIAPLYHWNNPALCHPRLQNLQTTPSGGILFEKCALAEN